MPFFILNGISKEISILKFKLNRADSFVQRSQLKAQIKDKQEFYSKCLETEGER